MPASSIDLFHMQDAKNNFHAMRPAPICNGTNHQLMGHSQNVHISRNCYYGYHDAKSSGSFYESNDCEMKELSLDNEKGSSQTNAKKRSADFNAYPHSKRMREDDSSMCSRVGTRSSPSHSASAFNINIPTLYILYLRFIFTFSRN